MSIRSLPLWAAVAAALLVASGCRETTELGKPCALVKTGSDGKLQPVLEKEVPPGQDFLSFGALDCADQVCVRDAYSAPNGGPEEQALGYCTLPCVPEQDTCEVTYGGVPAELSGRMGCRALVLDQATLDALKRDHPELRDVSSYFCAGARAQ